MEESKGEKRKPGERQQEEHPSKSSRIGALIKKLNKKEQQILEGLCSLEQHVKENDVSEIYSPPRVTEHARKFGLEPGWSLDLTTHDSDGRPWDFSQPEMRKRAKKITLAEKPMFVISSPMCTNVSILMNINWNRMHPEEAKRRWENAAMHMTFCCEVYDMQIESGRYFIHEHPLSNKSWQLPTMRQ